MVTSMQLRSILLKLPIDQRDQLRQEASSRGMLIRHLVETAINEYVDARRLGLASDHLECVRRNDVPCSFHIDDEVWHRATQQAELDAVPTNRITHTAIAYLLSQNEIRDRRTG